MGCFCCAAFRAELPCPLPLWQLSSPRPAAPPRLPPQNITALTAGQQVPLTSLWGPMDTQALALGYLANDTVPLLLQ